MKHIHESTCEQKKGEEAIQEKAASYAALIVLEEGGLAADIPTEAWVLTSCLVFRSQTTDTRSKHAMTRTHARMAVVVDRWSLDPQSPEYRKKGRTDP